MFENFLNDIYCKTEEDLYKTLFQSDHCPHRCSLEKNKLQISVESSLTIITE